MAGRESVAGRARFAFPVRGRFAQRAQEDRGPSPPPDRRATLVSLRMVSAAAAAASRLPPGTWHCMGGARLSPLAPARLGPVAQWSEPTAHNGLVGGSSPPGPTMLGELSQGDESQHARGRQRQCRARSLFVVWFTVLRCRRRHRPVTESASRARTGRRHGPSRGQGSSRAPPCRCVRLSPDPARAAILLPCRRTNS